MANTTSGLNIGQNLFVNGLTRPEVINKVIDTSFGFNSILSTVKKVNAGTSPMDVSQMQFQIPFLGNTAISCALQAAPTQSAANLIVTIPSGDTRWRVKDVVQDVNTKVFAKVINVSGSLLTLEPQAVALSSSTHFQNGSWMANFGSIAGNGVTTGLTNLSQSFEQDNGVMCKWRDTISEQITDRVKTEVTTRKAGAYWYTTQQSFMLQRNARAEEMKLVFQDYLYNQPSAIEGDYNQFGSIRWTAKNNPSRSTYMPLTSAPTLSDIKEVFRQVKSKKAQMGQTVRELDAYCGSNVIQVLQDSLTLTTQYTGQNSAFGLKEDSGFNVWILPFEGMKVKIHQYAMFDNVGMFGSIPSITGSPSMASTMMVCDWTPTVSVNGGEATPTISEYKWKGMDTMIMKPLIGMDVFNDFNTNLAQSELDAMSWQVINNKSYYVLPENVAWMELV